MRSVALCAGAFLTLAVADPAAARPVTGQDTIGDAVTQPLRDLSIIRRRIPDALVRASQGPYDAPAPTTCTQIATEVAALDEALGPDFDSQGGVRRTSMVRGLVVDGVRSVVDLPYRGLVRVITGARRRDERLQAAVIAGISRRSFLKGLSRAMACDGGSPLGVQIAEVRAEPVLEPEPYLAAAETGDVVQTVAVQTEDALR